MATLRTAIAIYDGVTAPLQNMGRAMGIVLNSFEKMQAVSGNAVDTESIQQARVELAKAETAFDSIDESIRRSQQNQNNFNNAIRNGSSAADDLWNKIKGIAISIGGVMGLQKVLNISDQLTQGSARLNLIVDDGGSVDALEAKIYASAQRSRANYLDMIQSVSKLGVNAADAFANNDELIQFAEQVQKNFTIAGTSTAEASAAFLQLTQAMASGVLRGDELRSVFEQAPTLIQAVSKYLDVPIGQIRDMAAEGQITADIVKNAILAATDETNAKFEAMPKTWDQIWTSMKNQALLAFQPILQKLNEVGNSERFQQMVNGLINGLYTLAAVATAVFDGLVSAAAWVSDNWSILEPIVWALVAAFIAYNAIGATKRDEVIKQCAELLGECTYEDATARLPAAQEEAEALMHVLSESLAAAKQRVARKAQLEAAVPQKETEIKTLESSIADLDKTLTLLSEKTDVAEKALKKLSDELKFDSKAQAEAFVRELEEKRAKMQKALEDARTAYQKGKSETDTLRGQIAGYKEQLADAPSIDTAAKKVEQTALLENKQKRAEALTDLASRLRANQSALENIRMQSGNLTTLEQQWTWVKAISNTANGNISGKEKIMLETYIQMTYFDRIIARANTRFMVISGGQYELKRRMEAENNRSQSGLELDVIDHYNGTERSVKSLSGGESFKASLSLALGLSDEIQASAGGIRLDSMFVDEGFGSLDEESLQQAMKALAGLTEGNRLVGIISHVAELKEKIEKQIIVTKDKSGGSRISVSC